MLCSNCLKLWRLKIYCYYEIMDILDRIFRNKNYREFEKIIIKMSLKIMGRFYVKNLEDAQTWRNGTMQSDDVNKCIIMNFFGSHKV